MTNKAKILAGKRKNQNVNPWLDLEKTPGVTIIEKTSR
jgi:hypothetical protein